MQEELTRGNPAVEGKATGVIKILYYNDEGGNIAEFKSGQILVTEMTDIDFLPAMKIAAAIVTKVGGVLCHASIISRELKKPCIVSIKDPSKLIDGKKVTVDATEGIIYSA